MSGRHRMRQRRVSGDLGRRALANLDEIERLVARLGHATETDAFERMVVALENLGSRFEGTPLDAPPHSL